MTAWEFRKGLQETGNGIYSYLQPDGSWGWSNSGLIVDGDESLLVDTLFDAPLTRDMLAAMQDATGISADRIGTVVNTHANGDHTHGNGLCTRAEIIASEAGTREMESAKRAGTFRPRSPRVIWVCSCRWHRGQVMIRCLGISGSSNFALLWG